MLTTFFAAKIPGALRIKASSRAVSFRELFHKSMMSVGMCLSVQAELAEGSTKFQRNNPWYCGVEVQHQGPRSFHLATRLIGHIKVMV